MTRPGQESLFTSAAQMAAADNYNDWTFSQFASYLRGDVLEVGCGVGSFTRRIVKCASVRRVVSIDISADAVDYCRAGLTHAALEVRCVDVGEVEDCFDAVICMNVLEHIEDHQGAIRHLVERIRPGGTLFLLVPAHQALFNRFDVESGHFRRYSKRDARRLLEAAGAGEYVLEQFYFNAAGALGYWLVYKLFRKAPRAGAAAEIGLFDRWMVPVVRRLEGRNVPFGVSLISIFTKGLTS